MLKEVRKGEELDSKNLKLYLYNNGLIDQNSSELSIKQFSNGYSNLTYLLNIEDKELVLRRPPFGAIKRGHDMSREYKVLSRLHHNFSKVPQAYSYCEDEQILGSPFYLMEKMNGIILNQKECLNRNISPEEFKTISKTWLNTFIELHELDYKAVGLSDLGKPNGYVERQVLNWSKQYVKAATQDVKEATFVMGWMQENQPKEYAHSLIHNDFKYDNVVFENQEWSSINAILDWEMCTLGDPLMDFGTSLAYWTMESDGPAITSGIQSPTILPGNPSRTELVEMYAQASGRDINHLIFYYSFGLFKIAVIAQQIFYRYSKGLTQNKKFAHLDKACALLCFMAKQAIDKKRIDHLF